MNEKHEYIAIGPELYKRVYWSDKPVDSWVATYVSDDAAKDAAPNWNAFTGKCLTCGKP